MTDEYINKKDVVNLAVMMQTHLWTREQTYNAIFCLPSADAVPVRHGRWSQDAIYYGEDGSPCIVDICTECGAYGYYADFNYCPNCGAKMYKENKDDDYCSYGERKDNEVTAWDYPDGYFEMEKDNEL